MGYKSLIFQDKVNERVGIGTTTPTSKLDVNGTGTGTIFSASRDTKVNGYLDINFLNQDTNFNTKESYSFSRGGVELMKLQSNGNVGIGTTTPGAYKLNVNGTGYFNGALTAGSGIFVNSVQATSYVIAGNTILSGVVNVIVGSGGATGSVELRTTTGNLTLTGGDISVTGGATINGNINLNTNGISVLMSSYKGANSDGFNVFIGGGGQSSIGAIGATYKGSNNTANGYQALYYNTTGYYNTANGVQALYSNTTGYNNTANGCNALYSNNIGYQNTANGVNSLFYNTIGSNNTAHGYQALFYNTIGYYNTANGVQALYSNTTGYYNTANGMQALYYNTTGYYNTANGYNAGMYIADGSTANQTSNNSLYLGYNSMALASGDTNEIVIGASAVGVGSNSVVLGNDSITKTVLKGNVGIGTVSPKLKLDLGSGSGSGGDSMIGWQYSSSNINSRTWGLGIDQYNYGDFVIKTSSIQNYTLDKIRLLIDNSGNVGIGTTSPTQGKLQVQGNIFTSMGFDSYTNLNPTSVWTTSTALISSYYVGLGDIDGVGLGTSLIVNEATNTVSVVGKTTISSGSTDTFKLTNDTNSATNNAIRVISQGVDKFMVKSNGDMIVNGVGKYTKQQYSPYVLLTATSGTLNWDLDTSQKGTYTLPAATTIANPTNMKDGGTYTLKLIQDATGSRTITWGTAYKFGDAGAPAISTLANKTDFLVFESDGTNMFYMGIKTGF